VLSEVHVTRLPQAILLAKTAREHGNHPFGAGSRKGNTGLWRVAT
jgi:hypothetical protein